VELFLQWSAAEMALVSSGEEAARTLREVREELFVRQSVKLNSALYSEKARI
jgi:hypothetical protein